ncbi:glycerol-3-phosphate 1-O-acyltransferase [Polymorphobacter arshaanensis]|uniref:Glycerol-3-phosphate acyltransferase n=1 Tax=Glacieibacterium arshaanense TaxID=2511025 RepID=A0A4Y9EM31_9SPHN|nr:glycerol-3-phosphate 1-O-acyltransferase PlsY [Polymorphobacter arshaanensis]TFU01430.1 glycerol-3-phosphate 1-O-acyltransferase [Polymorphobacter arshaanensis]
MMLTNPLIWAVIGYLLGSIPFGLLLARGQGIDLRGVGSGNIGATNVLRTGRKGIALATLLLDAGKGAAAVLLAQHFAGYEAAQIAGVAAFTGHCFPVWLKFNGGKGVSTLLGVAFAAAPLIGVCVALVWLGAAAITRYSSAGGLAAAVAAPVAGYFLGAPGWTIAFAVMAVLLWWRHADNIKRLANGTESKIGAK